MKDVIKHTVTSSAAAKQCYRDAVQMMDDHGYCTVEIKAGGRSLSQNALYWEWMNHLSEYINDKKGSEFSKDDLHDRMRHEYLGYYPPKKIGTVELRERLKTTTNLTTGEMYHYMAQIDAWAANAIGCLLPRPEDSQYAKLKKKNESGE
tara:strand:- start:199 stop:645 length:447 start_codon:yes stop_codon:yes gene_type:complete